MSIGQAKRTAERSPKRAPASQPADCKFVREARDLGIRLDNSAHEALSQLASVAYDEAARRSAAGQERIRAAARKALELSADRGGKLKFGSIACGFWSRVSAWARKVNVSLGRS